jgi:hypothetical protein
VAILSRIRYFPKRIGLKLDIGLLYLTGEAQWYSGLTNMPNHKEYKQLSTKSQLRAYL